METAASARSSLHTILRRRRWRPVGQRALRAAAISELFRDDAIGALLDDACKFSVGDREAILLVEGATDVAYLYTAARLLSREGVLKRVKVVDCGGAQKVALQAVVQWLEWRARY
jgi:hypothetical protein